MDKVMVEVFIPAAGRCFDIQVCDNLKIWEVIRMLADGLKNFTDEFFTPSEQTTLCDRNTGAILNLNITVKELKIKNGSKLMLI